MEKLGKKLEVSVATWSQAQPGLGPGLAWNLSSKDITIRSGTRARSPPHVPVPAISLVLPAPPLPNTSTCDAFML